MVFVVVIYGGEVVVIVGDAMCGVDYVVDVGDVCGGVA